MISNQVYEQVWKKAHSQGASSTVGASLLSTTASAPGRECPPMTVTYRLQVYFLLLLLFIKILSPIYPFIY